MRKKQFVEDISDFLNIKEFEILINARYVPFRGNDPISIPFTESMLLEHQLHINIIIQSGYISNQCSFTQHLACLN